MFFNNFFMPLGLGLILTFGGLVTTARADYKPPEGEVPDGTTVANGSRSDCAMEAGDTVFTLLAPMGHLGKGDRHTTLFFYVPVTSAYRLDVGIFDAAGTVVNLTTRDGTTPGLVAVELSTPLATGLYQVQAAIACGTGEDYDVEITRYFQREPLPALFATALTTIDEPKAQSNLYAQVGYWYDAFTLADDSQKVSLLQQLAIVESEPQQSQLTAIAQSLGRNQNLAQQPLTPQ